MTDRISGTALSALNEHGRGGALENLSLLYRVAHEGRAHERQQAVGQDAAIQEGVELVFDGSRQVGDSLGLPDEGRGVVCSGQWRS